MGGIDDRVAGFDAGGDDYLVKPFAFAELLARRRAGAAAADRGDDVVVGRRSRDGSPGAP